MFMKVYKITAPNSNTKEISVSFHGRFSFAVLTDILGKSMLIQSKHLPTALNRMISSEIADQIRQDSDNLIVKKSGDYVFNDKLKEQFSSGDLYLASLEGKKSLNPYNSELQWYDFPVNLEIIAQTAKKIIDAYPGHKIFSLGQTPAWLIKAASMLSSECEFGFIPFSGSYVDAIFSSGNLPKDGKLEKSMLYKKRIENPNSYKSPFTKKTYPSSELISKYHNLLDSFDLNPLKIINNFQENNTKTVILDFTLSGQGLASFLSILFDYASSKSINAEKFKTAIEVVILADSQEEISLTNIRLGDESNFVTITCEHLVAENLPYTEVILELAVGANEMDQASGDDRIVPSYPAEKWMEDPIWPENTATINYITSQLREAVEKICSQNVSEPDNHHLSEITSAALANSELAGISNENWADFWCYGGS